MPKTQSQGTGNHTVGPQCFSGTTQLIPWKLMPAHSKHSSACALLTKLRVEHISTADSISCPVLYLPGSQSTAGCPPHVLMGSCWQSCPQGQPATAAHNTPAHSVSFWYESTRYICGQLACMNSPLVVPGELSGPLLVQHCIGVQCCFYLRFQDPPEPVHIHMLISRHVPVQHVAPTELLAVSHCLHTAWLVWCNTAQVLGMWLAISAMV
jgi:hypothetical protein